MRRVIFVILASFLLYYCLNVALNFSDNPKIKKTVPY